MSTSLETLVDVVLRRLREPGGWEMPDMWVPGEEAGEYGRGNSD